MFNDYSRVDERTLAFPPGTMAKYWGAYVEVLRIAPGLSGRLVVQALESRGPITAGEMHWVYPNSLTERCRRFF